MSWHKSDLWHVDRWDLRVYIVVIETNWIVGLFVGTKKRLESSSLLQYFTSYIEVQNY